MLLLIDNYDSFTHILNAYFKRLGIATCIYRNDQITLAEIEKLAPEYIVISPGPCTPNESGISLKVIEAFYQKIPILGVCLGHQCIAHVLAGKVIRANKIIHGKTSQIYHDGSGLMKNIKSPFVATRYHSLVVEAATLPKELIAYAHTEDNTLMALRHKQYPLHGIQFHPESVLSEVGIDILSNFLHTS